MAQWTPPQPKAEFVPWKPDQCAGCGGPHPTFSRYGSRGPWLCGGCKDDPGHARIPDQVAHDAPPPPPPAQDRLL